MKKLAIAATGALALAGIGATVSSAVNPDITMKASISPTKHGTKKKPNKVKLQVDLATTPAAGEQPFAASSTVVHLPKQLVFNGKAFPTCDQQTILNDETKCPAKSRVGKGTAVGTSRALGVVENLSVKAFNGPGGNKLMLLVDAIPPAAVDIHAVIVGVLQNDSAPYGKKLVVDIPQDLQTPAPNTYATLESFKTTINAITGKGKKPYVGIASCPSSKTMAFKVDYVYQPDGSTKSTSTTAPCK
jgi:hypothetical protein